MKALMKLALVLIGFPASANERLEDPVVWKCYLCTPEERMAVALGKGEGEHLVYNAAHWDAIYGYRVTWQGERMVAEQYTLPGWITSQHRDFMSLYEKLRGEFVRVYNNVNIAAPGSPHGRNDVQLWGHHLSALNPASAEARETARRSLTTWMSNFLDHDYVHGRVLRYEFQLDGSAPLVARLNMRDSSLGYVEYYMDHDTRSWHFLGSRDHHHPIQESAADFLAADGGPRRFRYSSYRDGHRYFMQRAKWARVNIIGSVPASGAVTFDCERVPEEIRCQVY